jgi:rhodanese-related sulfurtransferase
MDRPDASSISPPSLHRSIGTAAAPVVIDVRRAPAYDSGDQLIVGAVRRPPDDLDRWRRDLPAGRTIVLYCVHGGTVSEEAAGALRTAGIDARHLEGGVTRWIELGLPTRRKIGNAPGRWVTRERPTIDRIACPWLVRRFIDPDAEFLYVPAPSVLETADRTKATPYDVPNVEFGHRGQFCSFDAFLRIYGIADAALD